MESIGQTSSDIVWQLYERLLHTLSSICYLYGQMEYYSAIEKEWNNAICSNVGGPRDYHTKWSKSERARLRGKKKERLIPQITYIWNRKYGTNELIYETVTNRYRKQTYGYQRGKGVGEV